MLINSLLIKKKRVLQVESMSENEPGYIFHPEVTERLLQIGVKSDNDMTANNIRPPPRQGDISRDVMTQVVPNLRTIFRFLF